MNSVNRRLLRLLSMVLELPGDYLWGMFVPSSVIFLSADSSFPQKMFSHMTDWSEMDILDMHSSTPSKVNTKKQERA